MHVTKHALFAIAIVGAIGAFVPFVEIQQRGVALELTAKELSFDTGAARKLLDYKLPAAAEARLPADVKSTREDVRLVAHALRWSFALFIPLGLVLLVAVLAQYRGRLTRGLAAVAGLAGLASVTIWFVLRIALDYGLAEAAFKRTTVVLELGAHLLLVAGAGAAIAGIVGVIKPEASRLRAEVTPSPRPMPR